MMDVKALEERIKQGTGHALGKMKALGHVTEREAKDTFLASEILLNLIRGHDVPEEQIVFLKGQSVNVGKALVLIGLQAVPGSSVGIVLLEKIAEKHGFSLLPRVLDAPGMPEEK